jgi:PKD repeat protein
MRSGRRRHVLRLIVAAVVAAGCSDAVGPRPGPNAGPAGIKPVSGGRGNAGGAITLNKQSSAMGESGTGLIAAFSPNPHLGDAIVVTFFWVGPSGIITSVTDRLTNSTQTPANNTYTLVDSITANGVSMATYVATNAQGFPDSSSDPSMRLAVQATLSTAVSSGGAFLSAYSGVASPTSQALGAHSKASGSGSSTTTAAPGAVAFSSGAMVYGVTMADTLVGVAPPSAPFQNVTNASSPAMKADAEYAVMATAGSSNPQWTWNFTTPSAWLASALVLNPGTPPPVNPATHLTFTVQPTGTTTGTPITPAVRVAAQDNNGNTDPNFTGSITISLGANPGAGTLSGTTSAAAVSGVATFSNLSINRAGNGYTLQAGATNPTGATSNPFNITTPATSITLDRVGGTLGETGRRLVKGFNTVNPHRGDAIVVTFFWVGSINIIDSVTDHLTQTGWPKVGNTYTLVDYVTLGGISMATYVAQNVQNFPDAYSAPAQDSILAIEASLHDSVVDGGMMMTAYSGVSATLALGAHSSRSGSGTGNGSTATVADPGAITLNPGALAYGVTMASALAGVATPPPPFTNITTMGDASGRMKTDGEYAISAGGGSVDPQWGWFFNSPNSWLATVLALNPASGQPPPDQPPVASFTPSCTGLTCGFTSTSSDPDGTVTAYNWNFGDGATSTVQNPSHTYAAAGTYTVSLTVTDNSGSTGSTSQAVTVSVADQPPVASFTQSCSALTCSFTSTSSDPDGTVTGYSWNFGDGATSTVQNPSHIYTAAGTYTVSLTVTDNSGSTGSVSHSVTVSTADLPPVASFNQSCSGLSCSFTSTSSDPDGTVTAYSWVFGDGATSTAQNPAHTYGAGGTYTVTLTVTDNSGSTNSTSHSITVAPRPPLASFTQSCTGLSCGFTSTSTSADGTITGYSWNFGDGTTSTLQNPSHSYAAGGTFTVTLTVTDNFGGTNSTSHSVTVAPRPPVASFTQSCTGLTCGFTSTSTSPDGTITGYSWNFGDGATSAAQNPSHTYAAGGTFTVTLTVTDNFGGTNSTSKSVTVAPRPPVASFTQSCTALTCGFTSTSSDPDGTITSYSWNFGDGTTSTAQNPSHSYGAGGTYTVTLTVTDNFGGTNSTSHSVTVTAPNQPPVVNAGPNETVAVGLLYTLNWSFTDADNDGPYTYSIDWGDGSSPSTGSVTSQGSFSNGHTYVLPLGTHTITVTVTDARGASGSSSKTVTVIL